MMSLEALFGFEFTNSINTEVPQESIYGQPQSFAMSGEKGLDRFGHVDNSDALSSTGRTGGAEDQCATCGGSGVLDEHSCPTCHGTGILSNDTDQAIFTKEPTEVESNYESAERSGDKGIVNDGKPVDKKDFKSPVDGPMVGRFDYPRGKTTKSALNFPKTSGPIKNESGADESVPADYKASTLFIHLDPNRPTLERGKEKYGTSVGQNTLNELVREYQNDASYKKFDKIKNPGDVDETLWKKAERASEDAFGTKKWPFISWWYQKQGGTFK
jgi:hypothetical protein